jgi:hypothetical protein
MKASQSHFSQGGSREKLPVVDLCYRPSSPNRSLEIQEKRKNSVKEIFKQMVFSS